MEELTRSTALLMFGVPPHTVSDGIHLFKNTRVQFDEAETVIFLPIELSLVIVNLFEILFADFLREIGVKFS